MLLLWQFYVVVVENINVVYVFWVFWMFLLYLLLINIFVLFIVVVGLMMFLEGGVELDSYVLSILLVVGYEMLALFVAFGGFLVAISMVIVVVIVFSIMIVNNLVLLGIVRNQDFWQDNLYSISSSFLGIWWVCIIFVLLLVYVYFKVVGEQYSLVLVGLIFFMVIVQFVLVVLGGIYWKCVIKKGAIWGLSIGFFIWVFCFFFFILVEMGLVNDWVMVEGFFGWGLF